MDISDEKLIEEVKKRLDEKNRAINDLRATTLNLEDVNKKLQDSESLKSNFLSNIRNEINNPLTTLVALSGELSVMKSFEEEDISSFIRMIYLEALNLDFQIRNVLMAADLEAGESKLNITKTDLNSIIDSCLKNLTPFMEIHKINLIKEGPEDIWINTDSDRLFIAILNLLRNGINFNREGGRLEISFGESDEEFFFTVKDEGIGIESKDQQIIFDRFKQLDAGTQKKYMGHGLGLSVTKAAVESIDGLISVESQPGEGSSFTLMCKKKMENEIGGISTTGIEFFCDADEEF